MTSLFHSRIAAFFYLCVISTSYPLASWLADKVDPLMTVLSRFWIAGLVLAAIYIVKSQRLPRLPQGSEWWRLLLLAAPLALYFISTFTAAKTQSPVVMAVLFTVAPLTPILVGFLRNKRAPWAVIIGMVLGACAAIYIAIGKQQSALGLTQTDPWLLIYCLSCLLFTANPVLIKSYGQGMPLLWRSVWILLLSGIVMAIVFAFSELTSLQIINPQVPSLDAWMAIIWIGVICTAIPMFLYQYAAHALGTIELGGWHYGLPVLVLIEQMFLAGREINQNEILASGLIILALILIMLPSQEKAAKEQTGELKQASCSNG